MYICSRYSRRKVVHNDCCHYVAKMADENKKLFYELPDATHQGYTECRYCNRVRLAFNRKKKEIKKFCKTNYMTFHFEGNKLYIEALNSKWIIITNPHTAKLNLYHKNVKDALAAMNRKKKSMIDGYHRQRIKTNTILGMLDYIVHHDNYRDEYPVKKVTKSMKKKKDKVHICHNKQKRKPHKDRNAYQRSKHNNDTQQLINTYYNFEWEEEPA